MSCIRMSTSVGYSVSLVLKEFAVISYVGMYVKYITFSNLDILFANVWLMFVGNKDISDIVCY